MQTSVPEMSYGAALRFWELVIGLRWDSEATRNALCSNRTKRIHTVCTRSEKSRNRDQFKIYCKSKWAFSSEECRSRSPWTCANPVRPGVTLRRSRCQVE